ncbi:hypothetical protein NHX12_028606 [Muraenolepis orangiensis]|uniref:Uncharacterized protein n=1 Tax=Muraenolepis orangiensis TaxID=630683 RepID=A0A9Q0IMP7_9TELE|nr:hypothetical protein NHX12_028606 [Muraenolepis orangiensis]
MRLERLGVPVYDLGSVRSLWEVRARKHKQRQKKEKERTETSALAKISQLPDFMFLFSQLTTLQLPRNALTELPPEIDVSLLSVFQLSRLKKLVHLDLAENRFPTVPICVLRMNSLQALDLSHNMLTDLPEDMDRYTHTHTHTHTNTV